jgi:hypothetical protein
MPRLESLRHNFGSQPFGITGHIQNSDCAPHTFPEDMAPNFFSILYSVSQDDSSSEEDPVLQPVGSAGRGRVQPRPRLRHPGLSGPGIIHS